MNENIKPIQTRYNGYRFRSRLEARWAVYFDAVGIKYEYEKEGFTVRGYGNYLPDFYFPDLDIWGEVKPDNHVFEDGEDIYTGFIKQLNTSLLILRGVPDFKYYGIISNNKEELVNYHVHYGFLGRCIVAPYGLLDRENPLINTVMKSPNKIPMLPYSDAVMYDEGHSISPIWYHAIKNAVGAARSARFEFGESGGL